MTRTTLILASVLIGIGGCQSDHATFTTPPQRAPARAAAVQRAGAADNGWADRRPIMWLTLSDPSYRDHNPVKNPNGWNEWWYGDLDPADKDFAKKFRERFDAWFADVVARTVREKGQGIIIKDARGAKRVHSNTYDGDPVNELTDVTQEMLKGWADKAQENGLWLGFLIRDSINVRGTQAVAWDAAATFADKVNEAKSVYGLKKMAVDFDSNVVWGGAGGPVSAAYMDRVRKLVGPDVLIIGEFYAAGYENVPAVLTIAHDLKHPGWYAPPQDSPFTVLMPLPNPDAAYTVWFARQLRAGAIPGMAGGWDSPENAWVAKQIKAVKR